MSKPDTTSIGANDFEQSFENVMTVKKRIDALETSMQNIIASAVKMPSALEVAGHKYVELTATATVRRRGEGCSTRHRGTTTPSGAVHNTAKQFTSLMGALRDGDILIELRTTIMKKVLEPLRTLREGNKKTVEAGKSAESALKVYKKKATIVEKKIHKYMKKNKSIGQSKKYEKQVVDRDKAMKKYQNKCKTFMDMYENLMLDMERVVGDTMNEFINICVFMLQGMLEAVQRVAPHGSQPFATAPDSYTPLNNNNNINKKQEEYEHDEEEDEGHLNQSPPTLSSRYKVETEVRPQYYNNNNNNRGVGEQSMEPFADINRASENPYLLNDVDNHSDITGRSDVQYQQAQFAGNYSLSPPPAAQQESNTPHFYEVVKPTS